MIPNIICVKWMGFGSFIVSRVRWSNSPPLNFHLLLDGRLGCGAGDAVLDSWRSRDSRGVVIDDDLLASWNRVPFMCEFYWGGPFGDLGEYPRSGDSCPPTAFEVVSYQTAWLPLKMAPKGAVETIPKGSMALSGSNTLHKSNHPSWF